MATAKNKAKIDVRYTVPADEEYLLKWLQDPATLYWFPMSSLKETQEAVKNWIGFAKFRASLTLTLADKPCGIATLFLMPYRKVAHMAMFYIVVTNEHQRQGLGDLLLKNLKHLAQQYFQLERVFCEVYSGCPLLGLLEKNGFQEVVTHPRLIKIEEKYLDRKTYEYRF